MIYKSFDPNQDIVSGRTTRVASGFWNNGVLQTSQSAFVDDFWSLTGSSTTNPSYGTSPYDVRRTMYYVNVYPDSTFFTNSDPYFSIAYGNMSGDIGSGSFTTETSSIKVSPTKAIYTQYKNMLLGTSDLDGMFSMKLGNSNTTNATDIWVIDFSAYKMKDRIDEGMLEFSLSGSVGTGQLSFIDDSPYTTQNQTVYQIIAGSLSSLPSTPTYEGLGLFYPNDGIVIINATLMAQKLGLPTYPTGIGPASDGGPGTSGNWPYNSGIESQANYQFTYNHRTFFESMKLSTRTMSVRKSEYVPARQYFVRVKNRDYNFSNNPTYVYDGTDGVHAQGTIRNSDFIDSPRTYITSIGLYDNSNNLVAIGKLSRPAVKSFSNELLIKISLSF